MVITMFEGIDVSAHNGDIDWKRVKAAGKHFVFVRAGWAGWDGAIEKNGGLDKKFHANMQGASAAGLNVGVYLYSYCKTVQAAKTAAAELAKLLAPYSLQYPVAFDIEDTSSAGVRYDLMPKADNAAIAAAFLDDIQKAGYYAMLYTYKSFAESYLDMSKLGKYDFWLAQYAEKPTYKGVFGIWQYTGSGTCPGVTGACDLNISYRDYSVIISVPRGESSVGGGQPATPSNAERLKRLEDAVLKMKTILNEL